MRPGWDAEASCIPADMHIVEKLTRVGNEIRYDMTIEDPEYFVEPWVVATRILRAGQGDGLRPSERRDCCSCTKKATRSRSPATLVAPPRRDQQSVLEPSGAGCSGATGRSDRRRFGVSIFLTRREALAMIAAAPAALAAQGVAVAAQDLRSGARRVHRPRSAEVCGLLRPDLRSADLPGNEPAAALLLPAGHRLRGLRRQRHRRGADRSLLRHRRGLPPGRDARGTRRPRASI